MADTHDERGPFRGGLRAQLVAAGTEAAEKWLAVRANRKMSDVNRRRLAGHVVNALWTEIETAVLEMAKYVAGEQLAAANAELGRVNRRANFLDDAIKGLRQQVIEAVKARNEATARVESATVLPERWRELIAERDAAVNAWSAQQDIIEAERRRAEKAEAEIERLNGGDISGWTAEENAEFEQRYGVKAAMQLRAANDRVWQIVQELRQDAVDAGRDPYQDPMARRLSAALVGAQDVCSALPKNLSGPQTCCTRHVHDGLMHICALAAGHDTHMCAEGDRWTTNDNTTEDDRG